MVDKRSKSRCSGPDPEHKSYVEKPQLFSTVKKQINTSIISYIVNLQRIYSISMKQKDCDMLSQVAAYTAVTSNIMVFGTDVCVGLQYISVVCILPSVQAFFLLVNQKILSAVKKKKKNSDHQVLGYLLGCREFQSFVLGGCHIDRQVKGSRCGQWVELTAVNMKPVCGS